jgi:hypothetical protein
MKKSRFTNEQIAFALKQAGSGKGERNQCRIPDLGVVGTSCSWAGQLRGPNRAPGRAAVAPSDPADGNGDARYNGGCDLTIWPHDLRIFGIVVEFLHNGSGCSAFARVFRPRNAVIGVELGDCLQVSNHGIGRRTQPVPDFRLQSLDFGLNVKFG